MPQDRDFGKFLALAVMKMIFRLLSLAGLIPFLGLAQPLPHPDRWQAEAGQFSAPKILYWQGNIPSAWEKAWTLWQQELKQENISLLKAAKGQKGTIEVRSLVGPATLHQVQIHPKGMSLAVASDTALFLATRSLRQLYKTSSRSWPCASWTDGQHALRWRGLHLDVSRHFMPLDFLKKYLDWMAYYKLNTFHWHLTDDQGWRLEIKAWPKLTEVGSQRPRSRVNHSREKEGKYDGKPHGGFYTQAQVRELVAYAAQRYITVVPEIELPGHAQAAITAYPGLGTTGENPGVWTDWGVSPYIFSPSDSTLAFLKSVMDEVIALFPSPYIHIGGDEALKDHWKASPLAQARIKELGLANEEELQAWFIRQIHNHVAPKGKRLVGWDEVLEGGLREATIMSWRGTKGGIQAALARQPVVMTPGKPLYLDHYQAQPKDREPLAIGGYNPLKALYDYAPCPDTVARAGLQAYIIGVQGNVWTEYLPNPSAVEYMVFPRICALAQIGWTPSPAQRQPWSAFYQQVLGQKVAWEKAHIRHSSSALEMDKP